MENKLSCDFNSDELAAVNEVISSLSPADRDLLAAIQESPFRFTTLEQFREFPYNTEFFTLEPNIKRLDDLGWSYFEQHADIPLTPALREALDPIPFGKHAMEEDRGCFTNYGYLAPSGDEWQHEQTTRPAENQVEKSRPLWNGWNRAKRNVQDKTRRSPTGKNLRRSFKEVRLCRIMSMKRIIHLPLLSPTLANTTRASLWANG